MNERIPHGWEPIGKSPNKKQFTIDMKQAAELLSIPPAEVMRLSKSGKLPFRYTGDRYRCMQSDIDSYLQEQEQKNQQQQ